MKKIAGLIVFSLILWKCGADKRDECVVQPEVSEKITVRIEQLQDTLANLRDKQHLITLLTANPMLRDYIFRRQEYPNDSLFIDGLYNKMSHPSIDTLLQETKRVFKNVQELEEQFSQAFTNIKYYYPAFRQPKVQTVISGLDNDLLVTDSLIIVSLDYYLGKGAKFRPNLYQYLLRRYEPEDIVPSCLLILGISPQLNKTDLNDKTVLADMIAYGKSFYFAKHMLPCTPDSVFMWYSQEDIEGSRENENLIWARFIQDKIIYSTSMMDKRNFLGERPYTIQVGEKCPGRIGQWIGWEIVKEYMKENKEVSLPELMDMGDAQRLFKESGYKPKKR